MPAHPRLSSYFEDDEDPPLRTSTRTTFAPDSKDLVGRIGARKKKVAGGSIAGGGSEPESGRTSRASSTGTERSRASKASKASTAHKFVHSGTVKAYDGLTKKQLREHAQKVRKEIQEDHKTTREKLMKNESWPTHKVFVEVERIKNQIFDEQKEAKQAYNARHKVELDKARAEKGEYVNPEEAPEGWRIHRVRHMHDMLTQADGLAELQADILKVLRKAHDTEDEALFSNPIPKHHPGTHEGYYIYNVLHWCFRSIKYLMNATEMWIESEEGELTPAQKKFLQKSKHAEQGWKLIDDIRKRLYPNPKHRKPLDPPLPDAEERKSRMSGHAPAHRATSPTYAPPGEDD